MIRPINIFAFFLLALIPSSYAQQFQNEDLNGTPGFFSLPTFWQHVPSSDPANLATSAGATDTPDLVSLTQPSPIAGITGAPYSGTTFSSGILFNDTMGRRYHHEGIKQTVTGFTIGQQYVINFYQAVAKQNSLFDNSGSWVIYIDNNLLDTSITTSTNISYHDNALQWESRNIIFTASDTVHTIKFLPADDDPIDTGLDGLRMGIDSINLINCSSLKLSLGKDTSLCAGDSILLDARSVDGTYLWQDGSTDATFKVTQAGTYWITNTNSCNTLSDTIVVSYNPYPVFSLGNDTLLCLGDTLKLNITNSNATYLWQDGSDSSLYFISDSGVYWAERTELNCTTRDSIIVTIDSKPIVNLGADTTLCTGNTLLLYSAGSNVSYTWQDGSIDSVHTVDTSGVYWVDVTNICGAIRDSIIINYNKTPFVSLGVDTALCTGDSLLLKVMNPGATYLWQDSSNSSQFTVKDSGLYWVEIFLNGCGNSDSINVIFNQPELPELGNDTNICEGDSIVLFSGVSDAKYLWSGGESDSLLAVRKEGVYWVNVLKNACLSSDTIEVNFDYSPVVDLGNDTSICIYDTLLLDAFDENAIYWWNNGSNDSIIAINQKGLYSVLVSNNCGYASDSIYIDHLLQPQIDLGADTLLCPNEKLPIDIFQYSATYLWNDSSNNSYSTIKAPGTYWAEITLEGCKNRDSIKVDFTKFPQSHFSDTSICECDFIKLNVSTSKASYHWQDGSSDSIFYARNPGQYWVEVKIGRCEEKYQTYIGKEINCEALLIIPNVFTPNMDGDNDMLIPIVHKDLTITNTQIFDRWGKLVYQTNDSLIQWKGESMNGNEVPNGTYFWSVDYVNLLGFQLSKNGNVTIFR